MAQATSEASMLPRVYLTSFNSVENPTLRRLQRTLKIAQPTTCQITHDIESADIVFYIENGYVGLAAAYRYLTNQSVRSKPSIIYTESDWPFPFLAGFYCSLEKPPPAWAVPWSFVLNPVHEIANWAADPTYLYSFVGRLSTHPVRQRLPRFDSPHSPCLDVSEAPKRFSNWDYALTYSETILSSLFVLCPRGFGASSIRIFEAMRLGRVPVIISDNWQPPPGCNWPSFSIRVPEAEIDNIPEICLAHKTQAKVMGDIAKQVYLSKFSDCHFLDKLISHIQENNLASQPSGFKVLDRIMKVITMRELKVFAADILLNR